MMVELMGLFLELMTNTIDLVMQPFSLLKLMCMLGVRAICLITRTIVKLPKAVINFHANICWKIMIWAVAFVSLPVRILTALQRERLLEMHLQEMQIEVENLAWNRKELDEQLQIAMKDRRIMASVLDELEEEHEKAIAKIELLEHELQDLKKENQRLTEIHGKGKWDFKSKEGDLKYGGIYDDKKHGIPLISEYDVPQVKSGCKVSGVAIQEILMHKDEWEYEYKGRRQPQDYLRPESKGSGLVYPFTKADQPNYRSLDEALDQCRGVAMSQSLFSATLSLLVGMIIWTADDPCMPLVVALFSVVGMSLKSVVQFFSSIKNRPASDAVALLSFNWFILGTLTYPTLPRVAHVMVPLAVRLADRMVTWLDPYTSLHME